jgi:hypothetical protein
VDRRVLCTAGTPRRWGWGWPSSLSRLDAVRPRVSRTSFEPPPPPRTPSFIFRVRKKKKNENETKRPKNTQKCANRGGFSGGVDTSSTILLHGTQAAAAVVAKPTGSQWASSCLQDGSCLSSQWQNAIHSLLTRLNRLKNMPRTMLRTIPSSS